MSTTQTQPQHRDEVSPALRTLFDWATKSDHHTALVVVGLIQFVLLFNLLMSRT